MSMQETPLGSRPIQMEAAMTWEPMEVLRLPEGRTPKGRRWSSCTDPTHSSKLKASDPQRPLHRGGQKSRSQPPHGARCRGTQGREP